MKNYNLYIIHDNHNIYIGSVKANSEEEAIKMAEEYKSGNIFHNVDFLYNMNNDNRKIYATDKEIIF